MTPQVRLVTHLSSDYWEVVRLRTEVLRKPLGLVFLPLQLAREWDCTVIGIFDGDSAVACAMVTPAVDSVCKVRQVAVEPSLQGSGLGRKVMDACEDHARSLGAGEIVLHARVSAVPFYLRIGYSAEGDEFEEVGIPHLKMRKLLAV